MEEIKLKVKLEFNETLKLKLSVAYRSPIMLLFTVIGFGMLWVVISYLNGDSLGLNGFPVTQAIFAVVFLIVLPFSIIMNTRKDLKANKFISQNIEYKFTETFFSIHGETFNMENSWTDLHKIVELKNWFILYTSKSQALFIPKDRFVEISKIETFRTFLKTLNIEKKLK
jgi:uncharacterized membrane protein YhdT